MVSHLYRLAARLALLGTFALGACTADEQPLTQLILVADTDVPNIDTIQFEVSEAAGTNIELAQTAHSATSGSAFVSLVRDQGSLGPITVVARGLRAGAVQVERTQHVSFVVDQTWVVPLHLFASCLKSPRCPAEQACDASGCIPQDLTEDQLLPWTGAPPPLNDTSGPLHDAGTSDAQVADAGSQTLRQCGDAGLVDIASNNAHCGGCDRSCPGGKPCVAGACGRP
jgi:hypothetical protein